MPIVIRGFTVIGRPAGSRFTAGSLSDSLPSSISWRITAEVKVLLMLAKANAVSGVAGVFDATRAKPDAPDQLVPSGNRTVADRPGMASFVRARSMDAWRRRSSAALASIGMTPDGIGEGWAAEGVGDVGVGGEGVAEAATDGADVRPVEASGVIEAAAATSDDPVG